MSQSWILPSSDPVTSTVLSELKVTEWNGRRRLTSESKISTPLKDSPFGISASGRVAIAPGLAINANAAATNRTFISLVRSIRSEIQLVPLFKSFENFKKSVMVVTCIPKVLDSVGIRTKLLLRTISSK